MMTNWFEIYSQGIGFVNKSQIHQPDDGEPRGVGAVVGSPDDSEISELS